MRTLLLSGSLITTFAMESLCEVRNGIKTTAEKNNDRRECL